MVNIYVEIAGIQIVVGTRREIVEAQSDFDFDAVEYSLSGSRKYYPKAKHPDRGITHHADYRSLFNRVQEL